jgi:pimeloyl-ACP methyl ester carboxylesterase
MKMIKDGKNIEDIVVLLHGIGRTNKSMGTLERELSKEGDFQILNIDYHSRKKDMKSLAKDVYHQIQHVCNKPNVRLHFVTHSMGGLITRELLFLYQIDNIGRIVMLAPPNQGSEVADFFEDNYLFKLFFGPSGIQLTTEKAKNYPQLPNNCEVGIIAGNRVLDFFSYFLLKGTGENDGR